MIVVTAEKSSHKQLQNNVIKFLKLFSLLQIILHIAIKLKICITLDSRKSGVITFQCHFIFQIKIQIHLVFLYDA